MKLIKLSTAVLVSVIALGAAQVSYAALPTTSTATVKLVAEDDVDAQKPTGPIVDGTPDGDKTGHKGPLSIDVRPHFQFGEAKVTSGSTTLPIVNNYDTNVQVTDTRGTGAGWDLKIKISEFETADKVKKLAGAQVSLGFKELKTSNATKDGAPTTKATIDLNGQAQSLLTAEVGTGMGTWANLFDQTKTAPTSKLVIPGGNYIGDYSATIEWSLSDTPR